MLLQWPRRDKQPQKNQFKKGGVGILQTHCQMLLNSATWNLKEHTPTQQTQTVLKTTTIQAIICLCVIWFYLFSTIQRAHLLLVNNLKHKARHSAFSSSPEYHQVLHLNAITCLTPLCFWRWAWGVVHVLHTKERLDHELFIMQYLHQFTPCPSRNRTIL